MEVNIRENCHITMDELSKHKALRDNVWVAFDGNVYDVTKFVNVHPGGEDILMEYGGQDISEIFMNPVYHKHSVATRTMLDSFYIGKLATTKTQILPDLDSRSKFEMPTPMKVERFLSLDKPLLYQVYTGNFGKKEYMKLVHVARHVNESPMMFANPYLDAVTRTSWWTVPLFWIPVILGMMTCAKLHLSWTELAGYYCFGLSSWTLIEYIVHRVIFHVDVLMPDHPLCLTLHFLVHGIHHFAPSDRYRLVMPPILAGFITFHIYLVMRLVLSFWPAIPAISAVLTGYVAYDMCHYYNHHGTPAHDFFRRLKSTHNYHHYVDENKNFGVTNSFWDRVCGTYAAPGGISTAAASTLKFE